MNGIHSLKYKAYDNGVWQEVDGAITEEVLACISVNGKELATFMCTPHDLDELALGFLRSEGLISGMADVAALTLAQHGTCVDVWLNHSIENMPSRKVITSGCGGGITFDDLSQKHEPVTAQAAISPEQIFSRMHELHQAATLYSETQGIHASALTDGEKLILVAEDVGRHNTIDRLWGKALKQNIQTEGLMLLASGRISSEMLSKAVKMNVPLVASRTSATSLSVSLAQAWHITVAGYVRRGSLRVYTWPERIQADSLRPSTVLSMPRADKPTPEKTNP